MQIKGSVRGRNFVHFGFFAPIRMKMGTEQSVVANNTAIMLYGKKIWKENNGPKR
jgi:hypothetical protein